MSGREDDGHAATKGDIRELWRGLKEELLEERTAMKEHVDTQIRLHLAECPAADEEKRKRQQNLVYGGGGVTLGGLIVFILKLLEVI